jgi:hypothetical protein
VTVDNCNSGKKGPGVVNHRQPPAPPRAVYDGQDRLGSFEENGDEYVARGRSGEVLGRFDTAHEAIGAIFKAAAGAR